MQSSLREGFFENSTILLSFYKIVSLICTPFFLFETLERYFFHKKIER